MANEKYLTLMPIIHRGEGEKEYPAGSVVTMPHLTEEEIAKLVERKILMPYRGEPAFETERAGLSRAAAIVAYGHGVATLEALARTPVAPLAQWGKVGQEQAMKWKEAAEFLLAQTEAPAAKKKAKKAEVQHNLEEA